MLRMRRSRIFFVLAAFTLFLLYHFKSIPEGWTGPSERIIGTGSSPAVGGNEKEAQKHPEQIGTTTVVPIEKPQVPEDFAGLVFDTHEPPKVVRTTNVLAADIADKTVPPAITNNVTPVAAVDSKPKQTEPPVNQGDSKPKPKGTGNANKSPPKGTDSGSKVGNRPAGPAKTVAGNEAGAPEVTTTTTTKEIHWTRVPEHFPVPSESIIPLPTGKEKQLPNIQHKFKDETALEKTQREEKQARIKAAFKKSWNGYVEYAWLHDEVKPESGTFRDPFCGWAATLVDSLDSLLILGLDKEFNHALEGLAKIDFTTTSRREIPVFETTIRYLGGLLSAHDLDQGKHKILLDKAVELAEVLMGAFDTPNRMPQTFYQWMPIFAKQPKRARTRVVMAELGSLSMEFTRLAQITGDDKYYDAIARITDELAGFQDNTKMPGLWPLFIDASGCKKPNTIQDTQWKQRLMSGHGNGDTARVKPDKADSPPVVTVTVVAEPSTAQDKKQKPAFQQKNPEPVFDHETNKGKIKNWGSSEENLPEGKVPTRPQESMIIKRQLESVPQGVPHQHGSTNDQEEGALVVSPGETKVECHPQGLASPPGSSTEEFSFGGMADSTYEYLPKQFLLLGGQVDTYKSMYEKAIDTANKHLLFRPMTPKEDDILVLGIGQAKEEFEKPGNLQVSPDLGHLLCFAGGMYGLGSKLFSRPEDLEIAKKMTDACVWAYSITDSGIMAEGMKLIPCNSMKSCPWNQTEWEHTVDPYPEERMRMAKFQVQEPAGELGSGVEDATDFVPSHDTQPASSDLQSKEKVAKRQLGGINDSKFVKPTPAAAGGHAANRMDYVEHKKAQDKPVDAAGYQVGGSPEAQGTPTLEGMKETLGHKEFVEWVVEAEHLPIGVPSISSTKYILRPEAIESVFYMYRLTGDPVWREKGWRMFEAIEKATDTLYGASAILDVLNKNSPKADEMESFWLAETLKYFYLLFSTEDTISLDEYVLNTEAHPFKRPAPA